MKISKQPIDRFLYVFEFDFNYSVLAVCRGLKARHGLKRINFHKGQWRFNDLKIVGELKESFPNLLIDVSMYEDMQSYKRQEEEKQERIDKAFKIKEATTSNLEIGDIKGELYPYQKLGVEFFMNNNGKGILADTMGCISGESEIIINRSGNTKRYKMKDAYSGFNGLCNNKIHNWILESKTRSYNEKDGVFRLNKIKKILYKGKKETITINSKSEDKKYSVTLTPDHKILTPTGWVESCSLKIGDEIMTNGKLFKYCNVCKKKTEHSYSRKFIGKCKICINRFYRKNNGNGKNEFINKNGYVIVSGVFFHPNYHGYDNGIGKHILVLEAKENNVSYKEWFEMCRFNNLPKNAKFIDSKKFSIHHINAIKHDNRIKNLSKMDRKEHLIMEAKQSIYNNFKDTFIPKISKVTSIKKGKLEDVYDIVMDDPHRNFITNGVVVHNCGKTLQSLSYIVHAKKEKTLVICPASVKYAWESEVKKWTKLKPLVLNGKDFEGFDTDVFLKHDIFIINYDLIKKYFKKLVALRWNVAVLDEFHYIKNTTAIRTKATKKLCKDIESVLLLSGTPILNRPIELYNGLNLIDPEVWHDYYGYSRRYCGAYNGRFGWDTSGATHIDELKDKISHYFLRRTKEEILPQLPPKRYIDMPVALDEDVRKKYDFAESEFLKYLREVKKQKVSDDRRTENAYKLARLNELRQLASEGKLYLAKEIIENVVSNGEKIIVFSTFNKPLEDLKEVFGDAAVMLTGKTESEQRREVIDRFQNDDKVQIFLGGIKSAGVGITLTAASNVLFIDYSWVPADHWQGEDRAHRIGQEADSVSVYQLYSNGTIDEYMRETIERKKELFNRLIENKEPISKSKNVSVMSDILKRYEEKL